MALRQVIYRVVESGGGDPTKAGIYDSIGLYARVNLSDTVAPATDAINTRIKATYADTTAGQSETLGFYAKVNASDTAPGQSDALQSLAMGISENNPAPADLITALRMGLGNDTNLIPDEATKVGFAGSALSDTSGEAIDARPTTTVHTWASAQTSAGAGATNGANALGSNNGTIATVTGSGLGGDHSITLTIPVASVPATGSKTLRCYIGFTAALATANVTFINTGGSPASGTVPVTTGTLVTAPTEVAITTVGTAFTVKVLVSSGGILAPSYTVDAVEIRTISVI